MSDHWDDMQTICIAKLLEERKLPAWCTCFKCMVRNGNDMVGLPNETVGVPRNDLAVDDEPTLPGTE